MEVCPNCERISLIHDRRRGVAKCYNPKCNYEREVRDRKDYFKRYVATPLNYENYCAQTPVFIRTVKEPLEPAEEEA